MSEMPCLCCEDWGRFIGSGEPSCPSCGHTVEDCNRDTDDENNQIPIDPGGQRRPWVT